MHQPESREQRIYYEALRTSWFIFPDRRQQLILGPKSIETACFNSVLDL